MQAPSDPVGYRRPTGQVRAGVWRCQEILAPE
jgi:hypothetical protein